MTPVNVITLTRDLISFNTINPPGNESELARYVGGLLKDHNFDVQYHVFDKERLQVVAEKGVSEQLPPVVFSGHLDTVPLGAKQWSFDPLGGEIVDGKIYGRGSSDMKAGLAAMITASIEVFGKEPPNGGVRLIFTAGEETGCHGVQHLVKTAENLGKARALIVGEPTANIPVTGHKGGLYMNVTTTGITAHSSMPDLGVNAIYKAAKAITKIANFSFGAEKDPLLGFPSINVGKMSGGLNLNSVPDHAEFTIDVRSTNRINHDQILERLRKEFGDEASIEILVNMAPVSTDQDDPFVQLVYDLCEVDRAKGGFPKALPYLTDGSVLQHFYHGIPTIILGPGQPEMAHQTDEFCYVSHIENAVNIYKQLIMDNG